MKKNSKLSGLYLGILFFLMYLPIGVVVVFSFNEARLPVRFTGFSLKWYQELFQDRDLIQALKNSLILAVSSCGVSAVIGTLGAVGLSRIHWKTKGVMEYISILPLMIPEIILGMVLMAFFYMLNLPFGMLTLLIGHTVFCVPYILMEVKARLVGMDPSLEEAARDLGAGSFRAFWDITLPLIMPAVISGSLLAFAMSMDDVVISIFITGPRVSTLPIKVYTQMKTGVTPEINALCTIMLGVILLVLAVYLIAGKRGKGNIKLIELKNLTKNFDDQQVLRGINLDIHENEFLTLLGPSGCGKTTTLRIIAGFEEPSGGEVLFNGIEISKLPPYKREINTVFQKYALFPHLNVMDNIGFGLNLKKVDKSVIEQKVKRMLKMVGLEGFEKRDVTLLSGGQQQRVAIARALVNEPKVLLLDEPLGALDAKIRKQMQIELKKIQREVGITFIYVTHDQEEALSMSDTVVVMNNGEIQQIGSPTDIYNEPENRFVAGFIGESNIIEGTMIKDFLVEFDGFRFECVDKGFEDNEAIEVVLRPEDLDIVEPDQAKIRGTVRNITFKGVHYEILIETELRTYMVHTTDYAEVGREVGLKFGPEDIHVMCRMGGY